jgi:hypothetical protein
MSNPFFAPPIVNSPYEYPHQHWELDLAVASTAPRLAAPGGQDEPTKLRDPKTWREAAKGYVDE